MLVLFCRAIILYAVLFGVLRLMGKRQISQLQPFDLAVTLIIADLASQSASDTDKPMLYSIVPILALFLVQRLVSYLSLKLPKVRHFLTGNTLIMIKKGVVMEDAMRSARYGIEDLLEQLRGKEAFVLSDVEYAILETNGDLSVLKKAYAQPPTVGDMGIKTADEELSYMLICDGEADKNVLERISKDERWLQKQLDKVGIKEKKQVFFAFLNKDGMMHVQMKKRFGGRIWFFDTKDGGGGKK